MLSGFSFWFMFPVSVSDCLNFGVGLLFQVSALALYFGWTVTIKRVYFAPFRISNMKLDFLALFGKLLYILPEVQDITNFGPFRV